MGASVSSALNHTPRGSDAEKTSLDILVFNVQYVIFLMGYERFKYFIPIFLSWATSE